MNSQANVRIACMFFIDRSIVIVARPSKIFTFGVDKHIAGFRVCEQTWFIRSALTLVNKKKFGSRETIRNEVEIYETVILHVKLFLFHDCCEMQLI